ncbi:MAG: hypothetical protein HYY06_17430 [Deltaproteobacteria bacterium]|nr:hypothetical protein [Deltaproteobacteria bacterium]
MKITLTARFQGEVRRLGQPERLAALDAILGLPRAFASPHSHSGIGLRKLHRSGIWEIRVGLGLRILFGLEDDTAKLLLIGTHDEVRRFLREL